VWMAVSCFDQRKRMAEREKSYTLQGQCPKKKKERKERRGRRGRKERGRGVQRERRERKGREEQRKKKREKGASKQIDLKLPSSP